MRNGTGRAALYLSGVVVCVSSACSQGSGEQVRGEQIGVSAAALQGPNGIQADLVTDSEWGQGYCVRVVVRNRHPSATTRTWSVGLDLGSSTTFATWDGAFSANTGVVTVTPRHNAAIAPSGSTQFGFCSRPAIGISAISTGCVRSIAC